MNGPDRAGIERQNGLSRSAVTERSEGSRAQMDVLRSVIEMSPLPMVLVDPGSLDGPIILANKAFTRLTGYEEAEVLGRNCRLLQGEWTDQSSVKFLRDAVAKGQEAQIGMWNYRKNGTTFWNSMFVGPVRDEHGHIIYWFGSQVDETARREADDAKARSQRMDSLGSMAAGIAHEFNNLMTVALGSLERARKEPLSPRQAEAVERVEWAARAAGRLTQQMLSFAGRQRLAAESLDLNVAVRNMDGLLRQAAADVDFDIRLAAETLVARVDAGQRELALLNLVRNATDASPECGTVLVSTRRGTEAGFVEVAVADDGAGMSADVAARAAEPFFTTKPVGKGTGLGLSMVAGFCRQSGGTMRIESERGHGTVVRLVLPETLATE